MLEYVKCKVFENFKLGFRNGLYNISLMGLTFRSYLSVDLSSIYLEKLFCLIYWGSCGK